MKDEPKPNTSSYPELLRQKASSGQPLTEIEIKLLGDELHKYWAWSKDFDKTRNRFIKQNDELRAKVSERYRDGYWAGWCAARDSLAKLVQEDYWPDEARIKKEFEHKERLEEDRDEG